MSYQLKLDEMLEALQSVAPDKALTFERALCATGNGMAFALATLLDIEAGETTMQGMDFGGICCPFRPKHEGQPMPWPIDGYDDAEAWEA
ncbi:hypothetical protein [Novosphingobium sp. KN65.2]|uniref:hypothetical protein n=1 Tax=Novosphingobium sp. KN65.2 TaxID=1478134 RepID=UPI0005E5FD77|nr:hypothetical protein [Novosphingobium sp. KN65.2]CDO34017.1 hypothetical protein SPHV1_100051 [Novosphingobium sp. KN65.2]